VQTPAAAVPLDTIRLVDSAGGDVVESSAKELADEAGRYPANRLIG